MIPYLSSVPYHPANADKRHINVSIPKFFFAFLHFHFSWLNWVRKTCIFYFYCIFVLHFPSLWPCILSTLSIQFAYISSVLTVSFNGSSSINSYTFSSIGSITSNNLIETIYSIISISFNFDSILDIIDCYQSQCCQLNLSEKSGKIYTTLKHLFCSIPCIVSFLENFLVQTAPLNLSVIL